MTDLQHLLDVEPELAGRALTILTSTTNAVLATIRADGSPRVSGIDPFVVGRHLCFGSMDGARKAQDLERDPRMALHAIPWESRRTKEGTANPGDADAKLTGRAVAVTDPDDQAEVLRWFKEERGFEPPPGGDLFRIDIASLVVVSVDGDELVVDRWTEADGRRTFRRT
ncbi:MAG: pyridoxamine 5'-phosphate oxidase family protein [Acidimicrobiales bacterium]|nr:pyridoxamine 5'-phosphate oxidase family protein [Actinomycetota bacterium]